MIIIHQVYMDNNSNKNLNIAADEINLLYKGKKSYFSLYFGSVSIVLLVTLFVIGVRCYLMIMSNIEPIKENWAKERCNPIIIPFAGLINAPEGISPGDYTGKNFTYCIQDILISISGYSIKPIAYVTYSISSIFNDIAAALESSRNMLSNIRTNIANISKQIMGRILNVTVPVTKLLISFNDMGQKVVGILSSGLYTSLGTYYALKSFMGALLQIIIAILISSVAVILGLWLSFMWPPAIIGTVLFSTIAIICGIVILFMTNTLHIKSGFKIPKAPKKPKICFDKNTLLKMEDGGMKKISEVNVGDKLWDYSGMGKDNFITAKLKLNAKYTKMYKLGNVIVSGTHRVKYDGKWIFVKNHPKRIIIENYSEPIIYCLNTLNKEIIIDDHVFSDWDEVTEEVIEIINEFVRYHFPNKKLQKEDIHTIFDRGFGENTMIRLKDGSLKSIQSVQLGDVLKNGEKVYGLVEIYDKNENDYLEKNRNASISSDSSGSCLENDELLCRSRSRSRSSFDSTLSSNNYSKVNKLYHLLTDKKTFHVGQISMSDYNSLLDRVLEKNKMWKQLYK